MTGQVQQSINERYKEYREFIRNWAFCVNYCAGTVITIFSAWSCWELVGEVLVKKLNTQQAIVLVIIVVGYCGIVGAILNTLSQKKD